MYSNKNMTESHFSLKKLLTDGHFCNILQVKERVYIGYPHGIMSVQVFKAIPHRACAEDALSDFSSSCIEIPQAYYRMSRDFYTR